MAIRNPDGTPYTIRQPNPIMISQERWDPGSYKFYHFHNWKSIIVEDRAHRKPDPPKPKTEPLQFEPEKIIIPEKTIQEPISPKPSKFIRIYCLAGILKTYRDPLYDEEYQKVEYSKTFEFEGVVIDQTDLSILIWTENREVTKSSIVYPRNNNRWWRIIDVIEKDQGYQLRGQVSDEHPSFSEIKT